MPTKNFYVKENVILDILDGYESEEEVDDQNSEYVVIQEFQKDCNGDLVPLEDVDANYLY